MYCIISSYFIIFYSYCKEDASALSWIVGTMDLAILLFTTAIPSRARFHCKYLGSFICCFFFHWGAVTYTLCLPHSSAIIRCVKGYLDANPGTLPIILSLENHCSHPFQEKMASILTATLEDKLYVPDSSGPLPSPLDLVGKVVVKGKRPPENEEEDSTLQDDSTIAESERNASLQQ